MLLETESSLFLLALLYTHVRQTAILHVLCFLLRSPLSLPSLSLFALCRSLSSDVLHPHTNAMTHTFPPLFSAPRSRFTPTHTRPPLLSFPLLAFLLLALYSLRCRTLPFQFICDLSLACFSQKSSSVTLHGPSAGALSRALGLRSMQLSILLLPHPPYSGPPLLQRSRSMD